DLPNGRTGADTGKGRRLVFGTLPAGTQYGREYLRLCPACRLFSFAHRGPPNEVARVRTRPLVRVRPRAGGIGAAVISPIVSHRWVRGEGAEAAKAPPQSALSRRRSKYPPKVSQGRALAAEGVGR